MDDIVAPPKRPLRNTYWVEPGRLLAGDYPARNIPALIDAGVTFFLDLTEEGEELPYVWRLPAGVVYKRMPVPDFGVPDVAYMERILDEIDAAIQAGHVVYVHCWYGVGRTGTVVGCYLVRHGLEGDEALKLLDRLRKDTPKASTASPTTAAQCSLVRRWSSVK